MLDAGPRGFACGALSYARVKAGIINDPREVKPAYENWGKDKVEWATISVTEGHDESRKP